jgi:hypothetical protein
VIATLRENLMAPDDVREFVAEFTKEWNRLAAERNTARAHDQTRLYGHGSIITNQPAAL